jgi:hypothetical protein
MSDDHWLRELAQVKRDEEAEEQARLDERWDRLSAGELSPEEEAELRALAESSEEASEVYEAFRPLGPDFHARVVEKIRDKQERRVLPFPPARLRVWLSAAAAVAALWLLVIVPLERPSLPFYAVADVTGGVQTQRGAPTGPPVFEPGSRLTVVVKPMNAVEGKLEARGILMQDGQVLPWTPSLEIVSGAVRLRGTLEAPGPQRVWIVVGLPGRIPPAGELLERLRADRLRNDGWQAVPIDLRVEVRPPS